MVYGLTGNRWEEGRSRFGRARASRPSARRQPPARTHLNERDSEDRQSGPVSELLHFTISSVGQLADECGRFHDFPFDLEAQRFDSAQQTWTGSFIRAASDPRRIVTTRWAWFVKVMDFPLIASEILIRNVTEVEIQDRAQIGTYTLRQVHPTASGCRFEFHQDCDICVHVNGPLVAEFRDIRELADARGRIIAVGPADFGIHVLPAARPL
jgi:hypothetical protein